MVGLIPQTVETARLQQANALFGLVQNVGMVLGPALAGVLIALTGPGEAIAIDALTFLVSAAFLARLRPVELARTDPGEEGPHGVLSGLREGWGIVRAARWILPGIGALVAYTVFVLPSIFVLGPVLAESDLGGATAWAVIATAFGVGAVAGSVIAYRVRVERTLVVCFAAMLLASSQGAILASGLGVPAIAALECVAGVGVSLFFTLWDLTVQQQVPPEATSRISAYDWAAAVGLAPIGLALSGPMASAIGVEETMRLGTLVGILAALACLAVPAVRAVRRPPEGGRATSYAACMTEPDDRPRRRLSAAERRDELLTAASEVFGRAGYHGASLEEIAQTAGVSKALIYEHFASKRELHAELVDAHATEIFRRLQANAETGATGEERLRGGIDAFLSFVEEHRDAWRRSSATRPTRRSPRRSRASSSRRSA